jgi:hypothetical protein
MSCGEAEGYRRAGVARFVGGTPAQITLSGLTEAVSVLPPVENHLTLPSAPARCAIGTSATANPDDVGNRRAPPASIKGSRPLRLTTPWRR